MTSKIIVNNIGSDTGINTVTFDSNLQRGTSNLHSTGLNVNNTFVHSTGIALGAGSTIGAVTGVTTYYGDGSQLTGIDATKIETGNTKVETVDTGSDGHVKITTEGSERFRIINNGKIFVGAYSAGDDFSDEGTFLNIRNNSYGGRIGFSNNTATAGATLMEQFAYWGNNKVAGTIISAGTDTTNKDDASMSFYTRNGGSVTERVKISSNGHVTKPAQPGFEASYPDGYNTSSSPSNYVTNWLRVHHNYGSHFNNTNGRFTAPVDGRYLIGVIMTNVGHSNPHVAFGINGGAASGPSRGGTNYTELWHTNAGSGSGLSPVHIFDLSANDYVNVWLYDYTGTADDPRCYFFGYLLG